MGAGIDGAPSAVGPKLLLEAYPNPFNPRTTVAFMLPEPAGTHA